MTTKQSKGGKARAEAMTAEERKENASAAARSRWAKEKAEGPFPKATHRGTVRIGSSEIPCAVLEDGRRILSEFGITQALGSRSGASKRIKAAQVANPGDDLPTPIFLAPRALRPFITQDLLDGPLKPVIYKDARRTLIGYEARALTKICDVWLRARDANALQPQQQEKAYKAEILIRALADVAIDALVDEATGFQDERARDELHRLLSVYLAEERLAWAKRFPDEFYKQVYRLMGWDWPVTNAKSPYLGRITNDVVYDRLPDGVLEKLRELNPTDEATKRRKYKHHQFLSADVGQPDLRDHILQIIPLMRISKDWATFKRHLDAAFPTRGTQGDMLVGVEA
ncbi:P63C domain-containing protein [Aurantimonas sp. VKM B-3413]|uniref:P63C domain-containing protein n=1 Tax=Aurantimonas sp. VKM B-3413 TaxID=2779401 RepID=UPI001E3362BB|nr:P63C domain-containing protein [Aurantimonas sp. VKM B-3413]MCB8840192.1 P63C domain-containing protein [Aurantimonas sp. VKM B-3413]